MDPPGKSRGLLSTLFGPRDLIDVVITNEIVNFPYRRISIQVALPPFVERFKELWFTRNKETLPAVILTNAKEGVSPTEDPFYSVGALANIVGVSIYETVSTTNFMGIKLVTTQRVKISHTVYTKVLYQKEICALYRGEFEILRDNPRVFDDPTFFIQYQAACFKLAETYKELMGYAHSEVGFEAFRAAYRKLISAVQGTRSKEIQLTRTEVALSELFVPLEDFQAETEQWILEPVEKNLAIQDVLEDLDPISRVKKITTLFLAELGLRKTLFGESSLNATNETDNAKGETGMNNARGAKKGASELNIPEFIERARKRLQAKKPAESAVFTDADSDEYKSSLIKLNPEEVSAFTKDAEQFFKFHVLGQNRAVNRILDALEEIQSDLQDKNKPRRSLLFLGPTGVGKTSIIRALAKFLFNSFEGFTRVDCSEFSERHTIARLIGAPPGYVGFQEEGETQFSLYPILSQFNIDRHHFYSENDSPETQRIQKEIEGLHRQLHKIERRLSRTGSLNEDMAGEYERIKEELLKLEKTSGYIKFDPARSYLSIVLFDEVEKAAEELRNLVLQILDDRRLTMANGEETDFSNAIIACTSNVGSRRIIDVFGGKGGAIGFRAATDKASDYKDQRIYEVAMQEAESFFSPEFLNRYDDIVVFHTLDQETIRRIFDIKVHLKLEEYAARGFTVELRINSGAKEFIVTSATDKPQYGARLLERKMKKYLWQKISRLKNAGQIQSGDAVIVYAEKGHDGKPDTVFYKNQRRKQTKLDA